MGGCHIHWAHQRRTCQGEAEEASRGASCDLEAGKQNTFCWAEASPGDIPSRGKRFCKGRETREELVCSGACKSFGKSSFRIWKSDREGSQEGWDGEEWGK